MRIADRRRRILVIKVVNSRELKDLVMGGGGWMTSGNKKNKIYKTGLKNK